MAFMKFVEDFLAAPVADLSGMISDSFDMFCHVEEVEGGIKVFFAKDDDEFTQSETPSMILYGDYARIQLLKILAAIPAIVGIGAVAEDAPEAVSHAWWLFLNLLSCAWNEDAILKTLGLEYVNGDRDQIQQVDRKRFKGADSKRSPTINGFEFVEWAKYLVRKDDVILGTAGEPIIASALPDAYVRGYSAAGGPVYRAISQNEEPLAE